VVDVDVVAIVDVVEIADVDAAPILVCFFESALNAANFLESGYAARSGAIAAPQGKKVTF
jgi:hypothetical protein